MAFFGAYQQLLNAHNMRYAKSQSAPPILVHPTEIELGARLEKRITDLEKSQKVVTDLQKKVEILEKQLEKLEQHETKTEIGTSVFTQQKM